MDIVNRVETYPLPGETVTAMSTNYVPGGKGANQAVAAARANANVSMIGAIGTDGFGSELLESLSRDNINTSNVFVKEGSSGIAFIVVNDQGENSIVLSRGANGKVGVDDVQMLVDKFDVDAVLLQNEISLEVTFEVIRLAYGRAKKIYYNPAPAQVIPYDILKMVDVLVLNETEASVVLNANLSNREDYVAASKKFVELGVRSVILTLGSMGAIFTDANHSIQVPAFKVNAVDTTAAGDTFIGAFASIYTGDNIEQSLRFASAASALAVTRPGAQVSIPTKEEVEHFLAESNLN